MTEREGSIDLYWIPLGAGAHVVRVTGKLFEAISAGVGRRTRCDLYHSALVVSIPDGLFVIEQAPVPDLYGAQRGVVAQGAVGTRWAGRFRILRYEIRRWRDGRRGGSSPSAKAHPVAPQPTVAAAVQNQTNSPDEPGDPSCPRPVRNMRFTVSMGSPSAAAV